MPDTHTKPRDTDLDTITDRDECRRLVRTLAGDIENINDQIESALENHDYEIKPIDKPWLHRARDASRHSRVKLAEARERLAELDRDHDAIVRGLNDLGVPVGDDWKTGVVRR